MYQVHYDTSIEMAERACPEWKKGEDEEGKWGGKKEEGEKGKEEEKKGGGSGIWTGTLCMGGHYATA